MYPFVDVPTTPRRAESGPMVDGLESRPHHAYREDLLALMWDMERRGRGSFVKAAIREFAWS